MGKMVKGGQKVPTSSYKISSGHVMYRMVTIVNSTGLCIWKLLGELHKKNMQLCKVTGVN